MFHLWLTSNLMCPLCVYSSIFSSIIPSATTALVCLPLQRLFFHTNRWGWWYNLMEFAWACAVFPPLPHTKTFVSTQSSFLQLDSCLCEARRQTIKYQEATFGSYNCFAPTKGTTVRKCLSNKVRSQNLCFFFFSASGLLTFNDGHSQSAASSSPPTHLDIFFHRIYIFFPPASELQPRTSTPF